MSVYNVRIVPIKPEVGIRSSGSEVGDSSDTRSRIQVF